ncbi:MAG: replicative DNA helicase, partial [Chloroflexi bacterium]
MNEFQQSSVTPYSQEAEQSVIGAVLINPNALNQVAAFLMPEDFFLLRHTYIWEALLRISERNEPLDYRIVAEELQAMGRLHDVGGEHYLVDLISGTPNSVHAEVYGRIVKRAAIRRKLIQATDEIRALAADEARSLDDITAEAEARLFSITEEQFKREFIPLETAISEYFDKVEEQLNTQRALGLPTGFRDLDKLLGGFQKSDLIVFAGRPGMGKTSFMLSVALNAARFGARVAL